MSFRKHLLALAVIGASAAPAVAAAGEVTEFGDMVKLALRKISLAPQMLPRLPWLFDHFRDGGLIQFVNVTDENGQPMPYTDIGSQLAASAVTWDDLKWIKEALTPFCNGLHVLRNKSLNDFVVIGTHSFVRE